MPRSHSAGMMTLAEYLAATGTSQVAFARRVNTTQAWISKLCDPALGKSPSMPLAMLIQDATHGRVPIYVWPEWQALAPKSTNEGNTA